MDFSHIKQVCYYMKGETGQLDQTAISRINAIAEKYFSAGSQIMEFKQLPKIAQDEVLIEIEVIAIR